MNSVRWLSGFAVAILVAPALGAEPQLKTIMLPEVEVRSGPSDQYYATCKLHYGDPVDVLGIDNKNWLKITPPIDSFDWVNVADIEFNADGKTATVKKKTLLRRGSALTANKLDSVLQAWSCPRRLARFASRNAPNRWQRRANPRRSAY